MNSAIKDRFPALPAPGDDLATESPVLQLSFGVSVGRHA